MSATSNYEDVAGNPTCSGQNAIGYDFGFKTQPEPTPPGTYSSGDLSVTLSGFTGTSYTTFTWSSNIGVDAVIVKGGSEGARIYYYDPESTGDSGLTTPTGQGVSHTEFCYDYEQLGINKTANGEIVTTYTWTIEKSVTPTSLDLFVGETDSVDYTVTLTKDGGASVASVAGEITISNPAVTSAEISSLTDSLFGDVSCPASTVPADGSVVCSYSIADLSEPLPSENTATVTTNSPGFDPDSSSATADISYTRSEVNGTVTVSDGGDQWSFSESGSQDYERDLACAAEDGEQTYTVDNTATIDETGQSASATVTVNCYGLTVAKTAVPAFTRTYEWDITKTTSVTETLLLSEGQQYEVPYAVTVEKIGETDGGYAVTGTITVTNNHPSASADGVTVRDDLGPVSCPSTSIGAGGSLNCTYEATELDGSETVNKATATLSTGAAFEGTASFSFDEPTDEVDECILVSDTSSQLVSNPADVPDGSASFEVCVDGTLPQDFMYSLMFGTPSGSDVVLVCDENTYTNTASFETNDTQTTGSDTATVNADVACATGCTLTPGYWKTHSAKGPAPYDDTWAQIGEDADFFLSGQSYYNVLWTAPQGNAYYILASAYIAAELNQLNGASTPSEVSNAFQQATGLFLQHTPEDIGNLRGQQPPRPQFLSLATILDDYNNGLTGPGHCSEDGSSAN